MREFYLMHKHQYTFDILKQTEHYRILTHYIDSSQNNKLKNIIKSNLKLNQT